MRASVAFGVCLGLLSAGFATPLPGAESTPAAERESFVRIVVLPERLELQHGRDARRVIVTGFTADGRSFDLTAVAALTPEEGIALDAEGYITGTRTGESAVRVSAGGHEARVPVTVASTETPPVHFLRDIEPVLAKAGCNQGACHGAQAGKAGFKLSLRGYDPLFDYRSLIDDVAGRRFDRAAPAQSLMLQKPTAAVPHEGGFLFDEESRYYQLLATWIAEGCRYDTSDRPSGIEVRPARPLLQGAGEGQQLLVIARYPDGSTRDVTREAIFETSDLEVLSISTAGRISALRRGEAAALVRYEGAYASAPVSVLGGETEFVWQPGPEQGEIDRLVNAKLKRSKINPSDLCTDAEFLRRVSIDLTGLPPSPEQLTAFLADSRPSREKRDAKIDELLASPGYVDHWTLKWGDLLLANRKEMSERGVWAFRNWLRRNVAQNTPLDEFVTELLTARGNSLENPAANYFRVAREPDAVMENMTQVFLGTRFNCNKCHDHPFERWTQRQYYELAGYFAAVGYRKSERTDAEYIYSLDAAKPVVFPQTNAAVAAKFPFEHAGYEPSGEGDPRVALAQWLVAPENPYFARSLANRYWSYFLGKGIIDPVDDIRASNPPTNPELLAHLEQELIRGGYDIKKLIRQIVTSATYQRSYQSNETNGTDEVLFSRALPRRLAAEQLHDSLLLATGAPSNLPGLPPGFRATQSPDPGVKAEFLDLFGRAPRDSPCECERTTEVSLAQTLNLVNGGTVAEAIAHPQGRIARWIAEKKEPAALVEGVYLATLCRMPTAEEQAAAVAYVTESGDVKSATEDLMWALVNSPAFLFNR